MPPPVRGVMNLRGSVVPVVDLALKFGQPETPAGKETYIVVFDLVWNGESVRLGLMTTMLGRVIDAADEVVKPVPDFGTRIRADYLRGIVGVDGQFVLLLNVDRLLSPAELLGTLSAPRRSGGGRRGGAGRHQQRVTSHGGKSRSAVGSAGPR